MNRRRILLSLIIALVLLMQAIPFPAMAAATTKVVTLGANLSSAQKADMLRFFGVIEAEVEIILITNQDERNQLASLIPLEKIGSKTFSCALVSPTSAGGIQVKTANLNYVSSNMIASTLCTSGVVNCDVLAAAPFSVSGTGALTGVMMAYETASGEVLLPERKMLANEELVTTNNIAETIGRDEATIVVNDIKIRIIRDNVTEKSAVTLVVDEVVNTTEQAMQDRAKAGGAPVPKQLSTKDKNSLYDFAYKIGQMGYKYEDVQSTLERVTINAVTAAGIEDPLVETFDPSSWNNSVSSDSILANTDDKALGDDAGVNSTFDRVFEPIASASTASISLTTYTEVENASLIDGSDMLALKSKSGGYALATIDGTPLTDAIYTSPSHNYGLFEARLANKEGWTNGALASDGSVAIPFAYGDVEILNENWGIGITLVAATADDYDYQSWSDDNYYKIENVDIYWLPTSTYMASLTRANFKNARAYGSYLNIMDRATGMAATFDQDLNMLGQIDSVYDRDYIPGYSTFSYNGQYGLKDANGNEILPASYRSVNTDVKDGYFIVSTGSTDGLVNLYGQLAVPAEYDNIRYSSYSPVYNNMAYVNFGYVCVENDDKLGYYKVGEGETCPASYPDDSLNNYGVSGIFTDAYDTEYLISADGLEASLSAYSDVYVLNYGAGTLYRTVDEKYNNGLIDWHGEELLPCAYTSIKLSGSGSYLAAQAAHGAPAHIYKVDYIGFPEIDLSTLAMAATNTTVEVATVDVDRMSAITLVPYSSVSDANLIDGTDLLYVSGDSGYALATLEGDLLTEAKYDNSFYNNYGWLITRRADIEGWSEGTLGSDGSIAIPFTYGSVEILNENWGLGYNLVPTEGDEYDFHNWYDDSLYLIDTVDIYWLPTGTYLGSVDRATFGDAGAYGETINIEDRASGNVGCFDKNLNLLGGVNSIYDDSYAPSYFTFYENGQYGMKAPDGTVILPASYRSINDYAIYDGHFTVSTGETKGLVNLDGQLVVPAEYEDIRYSFYAPVTRNNAYVNFGYVCVRKDGKLGYYSLNEGETCPPEYSMDQLENYGVSALYTDANGDTCLLAADGVKTSLAAYSSVYCLNYSSGALLRTANAQYDYGLIDWHGNEVLPCAYDSIKLSGSGDYLIVRDGYNNPTVIYRVLYDGSSVAEVPAAPEVTAEPEIAAESGESNGSSGLMGSFLDMLTAAMSNSNEEAAPTAEPTAAPTAEPTAEPTAAPTAVPTAVPTAEPTAAPAGGNTVVSALLDSALLLVQTDFTGNAASVRIILDQAMTALGDSNPNASTVLNSALTLIDTGVADANTIALLIQSVSSMLG